MASVLHLNRPKTVPLTLANSSLLLLLALSLAVLMQFPVLFRLVVLGMFQRPTAKLAVCQTSMVRVRLFALLDMAVMVLVCLPAIPHPMI